MSSPLSFHGSFQFLTPQLPDHFGSPEVTTNEFSLPSSPSSPDHSSSTLSPSTETCELSTSSAPTRPRRSGSAIPRPRNAFIIFRSEFYQGKIKNTVERDHRHVSRILGHIWAQLPKEEKDEWKRKAEAEKAAHLKKYPGYRFSPTPRAGKPLKRNVNRNGTEDMMRCRQVAAFILAGKEGDDLEVAVKDIDSVMPPPAKKTRAKKAKRPTPAAKTSSSRSAKASGSMVASPSTPVQGWIPAGDSTEQAVDLAFRSPLLPPTKMLQEEYLGPVQNDTTPVPDPCMYTPQSSLFFDQGLDNQNFDDETFLQYFDPAAEFGNGDGMTFPSQHHIMHQTEILAHNYYYDGATVPQHYLQAPPCTMASGPTLYIQDLTVVNSWYGYMGSESF